MEPGAVDTRLAMARLMVQSGKFEDAAEKCLELLKSAPDCMSARNNLSLAYFQSGNVEKAVHVAEETCRLAPHNRFAEATLGKLRFGCIFRMLLGAL